MLNDIYQVLDPVIVSFGPFTLRWYGLFYALGILVASLVFYRVAKRWKLNIDFDTLTTLIIIAAFGIIFGSRVGYCLIYGDGYYLSHPLEILAFSQGGMAFHGGMIGGSLAAIFAAKYLDIPLLTLLDLTFIGLPAALFLGRCANFINGELWGGPTDLPWGVVFGGAAGDMPRHPSQLYEALLEGVLLFVIMNVLSRIQPVKPRGFFTGVFMTCYGVFRFGVEFIRVPDVQMGYIVGGWMTTGQLLSIPLVVIGVALIAWSLKKGKPQRGRPLIVEEAQEDSSPN